MGHVGHYYATVSAYPGIIFNMLAFDISCSLITIPQIKSPGVMPGLFLFYILVLACDMGRADGHSYDMNTVLPVTDQRTSRPDAIFSLYRNARSGDNFRLRRLAIDVVPSFTIFYSINSTSGYFVICCYFIYSEPIKQRLLYYFYVCFR